MKKWIGFLFALSFVSCNVKNDCIYENPADIGDGLRVSSLKEKNLDVSMFDKINKDIGNGIYGNIHSLLVIVDNGLVIEQYYNDWKRGQLHFLASNTKSFNPILIGMAIEQGKIESVEQRMLDFFPEYSEFAEDSLKNNITIKDLLTNTSGFSWDEQSLPVDDPGNMGLQTDKMDNWLKASLELPMDTLPGTKYVYSGPNNIILGEIVKRATGMNVSDFAVRFLFEPIGISEHRWGEKNGIYATGGGLWLKSRDVAKYGLLHLNKGKWDNKAIVSQQWIEKTFEPFIEIGHPFYGCYQWQMVETPFGFNAWFIPGNGGQIIGIVPVLNMVIVINADNRKIPKDKRASFVHLMDDIMKMHPKLKHYQ